MNLRSSLRYARYRCTGWITSCFSVSNAVFFALLVGMMMTIVTIQKYETRHPLSLLDPKTLPTDRQRREIYVTTAKVVSRNVKLKVCPNATVSTNDTKNVKTESSALKMIYTPKFPFRRKHKSTTKQISAVPDIYRLEYAKTEANSITRPAIEQDIWIRVPSERNKVMVYSAFWDSRFEYPNVRIMAVMKTKGSPDVRCRYKMPDGRVWNATVAKKVMNEHWRLKYASFFISCQFPSKMKDPPSRVWVSTYPDYSNEVSLRIHHNKNDTVSARGDIAVCVKPLHYEYDRATWMLEFLELHRLLGVDHFIFYNHTVGGSVQKILSDYKEKGIVTVLPWQLGIRSQKDIRTEAIFSSLNDCLFRTMYLFKYVIMLDFDEYIIPRDHDTYQDMIESLERDSRIIRGKPGSFVFRNTFFYLYWENDTTAFGVEPEKPPDYLPYLITQYKTRRLIASMKPGSRSKYIVVPDRAVEVGNHVVWRHTSGSRSINVPDAKALLHHYRICEFGGFSCLKKKSLVDHVATRFGPELLARVQLQCQSMGFRPDGKCPLSPPLGSPW